MSIAGCTAIIGNADNAGDSNDYSFSGPSTGKLEGAPAPIPHTVKFELQNTYSRRVASLLRQRRHGRCHRCPPEAG
jgi:hypothetical protein